MGIVERRKREKKRRRAEIIDAAEQVFFSKGLDIATMDDVAEKAELSKGTLYLYFNSKTALVFAILKRGLEIMTDMFRQAVKTRETGFEKVTALGWSYLEFAKQHPDYFHTMMHFDTRHFDLNLDDPVAEECTKEDKQALDILVEAIETGIHDGTIRKDIPPTKLAMVLWAQSEGIVMFGCSQDEHMQGHFQAAGFTSNEEMIELAFELTLNSLCPAVKGEHS